MKTRTILLAIGFFAVFAWCGGIILGVNGLFPLKLSNNQFAFSFAIAFTIYVIVCGYLFIDSFGGFDGITKENKKETTTGFIMYAVILSLFFFLIYSAVLTTLTLPHP